MIDPELVAKIRRYYFAEHWKVGTIASELGLHHATVRDALFAERDKARSERPSPVDPYMDFIRETLQAHPRLVATRIFEMVKGRGYTGSLKQLRRKVGRVRPRKQEAFLRLHVLPGEQAQVDWAHFGKLPVGGAQRLLSCFVLTLSYSRALFLEFFYDQGQENFLRGHVRAFADLGGVPRVILYDNLRSAVLERHGDQVRFHPRLIELSAHYHFQPRPCAPRRGNEKGRVERTIRYVRESFFAARRFAGLEDLNRQARLWRDEIAHRRPWPDDDSQTVADVFAEEKPRLLPLPLHAFDTERLIPVFTERTIYVPFDANHYSIPPRCVGVTLGLVASDKQVRIFEGTTEVARHTRSYDRKQWIEDHAHTDALLKEKRKARSAALHGRLSQAVPESEALLEAALSRGESIASQAAQLTLLLDDYGQKELKAAIQEALERRTPRASSVAYLLQRRRRQKQTPRALPVDLTRRPDLADLHVTPHEGNTYDELSKTDASDDER
jgi:transposase